MHNFCHLRSADMKLAGSSMGQLIPYSVCVVHRLNLAVKEASSVLQDWFVPLNAVCKHMRKSCKATYIASTAGQIIAEGEHPSLPAYKDIVRIAADCQTRFISKCAVLDSLLKHKTAVTEVLELIGDSSMSKLHIWPCRCYRAVNAVLVVCRHFFFIVARNRAVVTTVSLLEQHIASIRRQLSDSILASCCAGAAVWRFVASS